MSLVDTLGLEPLDRPVALFLEDVGCHKRHTVYKRGTNEEQFSKVKMAPNQLVEAKPSDFVSDQARDAQPQGGARKEIR